jgi:hypothetical protein
MRLMWEFIDTIANKKILSRWHINYDSFLDDEGKFIPTNVTAPYLVYPQDTGWSFSPKKDLTVETYRQRASVFLDKIFKSIDAKDYIVLDQFISPNVDDDMLKSYVKNLKRIHVYRDPRDVFATAISLNVPWLPKTPQEFIGFYKRARNNTVIGQNKKILYIRFEDLVLNYDENSKKIMDFIGLKKENHKYVKGFFDPSISKNNVGLYKRINRDKDIELIKNELKEFCYEG